MPPNIALEKIGQTSSAALAPGPFALPGRTLPGGKRPTRIAFLFNAQRHQLLHGVTSAAALARDWDAKVDILSPNAEHLSYARELASRYSPSSPLGFTEIGARWINRISAASGRAVPPKLLTLILSSPALSRYDAIVLPERTSTILRWFGVRHPRLIHIDHGAGDRAIGFDPRIRKFDFVMMPGEKHRRRLLAEKLVSPDRSAITGYPKFEAADLMREPCPLFADEKPVILYNPHFSKALGSWHRHGVEIVRQLAACSRFNLIVAPHVRLFDDPRLHAGALDQLAEFMHLSNVHVDLGSDRSVDMTYTTVADIYLGDVSSQVYEFLRTPRPCLFVNAQNHHWQGDPNFVHWSFGPVIDDIAGIGVAIDDAIASHDAFREVQRRGFADTFDLPQGVSSGIRVAMEIARYLGVAPAT